MPGASMMSIFPVHSPLAITTMVPTDRAHVKCVKCSARLTLRSFPDLGPLAAGLLFPAPCRVPLRFKVCREIQALAARTKTRGTRVPGFESQSERSEGDSGTPSRRSFHMVQMQWKRGPALPPFRHVSVRIAPTSSAGANQGSSKWQEALTKPLQCPQDHAALLPSPARRATIPHGPRRRS